MIRRTLTIGAFTIGALLAAPVAHADAPAAPSEGRPVGAWSSQAYKADMGTFGSGSMSACVPVPGDEPICHPEDALPA